MAWSRSIGGCHPCRRRDIEPGKTVSYLTLMASVFSKITSKSQTVIPREVRDLLGLKPGDRLRYRKTPAGIVIEKAGSMEDDPFAVFTEWSSAEDDKAYEAL